ncbi:hypothetical protein SEEH8440_07462, partial [Salmonella enterica subsp. enterica serovar Heidelberg str. N18440]
AELLAPYTGDIAAESIGKVVRAGLNPAPRVSTPAALCR